MIEIKFINVSQLFVDMENPRLDNPQPSQLETIRTLVNGQKIKIYKLARDILGNGLNPSEAMIVMPLDIEHQNYRVLEGNRRLCALKILENPDIVFNLFSFSVKKQLKEMNSEYQQNPITNIPCIIVPDRDAARHWIEIRHGGEQKGAGIVRWGAAETARFRQRFGQKDIHMQILDFLEDQGALSSVDRKVVPITSMKRVVQDKHTREQLGYDIKNGGLLISGDSKKMIRVLTKIASDLSSGNIKTKDIYLKNDRVNYINRLLAEGEKKASKAIYEDASTSKPSGKTADTTHSKENNEKPQKEKPSTKNRCTLIPNEVAVEIHQTRINEIYYELKNLQIQKYPNSVAVLFRVFIELCVDDYICRNQGYFPKRPEDMKYSLRLKLIDVADNLKNNRKLSEQQVKAVKHAAQPDNFVATSVNTLHQYVHNPYFKPALDDLRSAWDNLEPFIVAIWS